MTKAFIAAALPVAAMLVVSAAARPAHAACYESGVGCTDDHYISRLALSALSCDALWTVRNAIFDENGYCFKTARAKEVFSNQGCTVTDPSRLRLNVYERTNIDRVAAAERKKGCR